MKLRVYTPADRERSLTWAKAHPERVREIKRAWKVRNRAKHLLGKKSNHVQKSFGLSLLEYKNKLATQGDCCAICEEKMKRPNLDHCHKTGHVRAFLCTRCNSCLHVLENPDLLGKAVKYLQFWSK